MTQELVKELRSLDFDCRPPPSCIEEAADTIERLQADLAARDKTIETLREDAERYRWLRGQPMLNGRALVSLEIMDINEDGPTGVFYSHDGIELDNAIDAARSEETL